MGLIQSIPEELRGKQDKGTLESFDLTSYDTIKKALQNINMGKVDKVAYDLSKQIDAKLDRLQTKVHALQDKNMELEQHIKQLQG